jgi:hypothetical protein
MKQLASALAALTLASTVAPSAFADDTAAPPQVSVAREVRYPPSSARPKIIIGGVAIFGLAYAASFGLSASWPGGIGPKIPFAGPWIALGKIGCALDPANCVPSLKTPEAVEAQIKNGLSCAADDKSCQGKVYALGVAFALDGILQLAGLGLIAEGIAMKTESSTPPKKPSLAATLRPVPTISAHYTGLGIVGSF